MAEKTLKMKMTSDTHTPTKKPTETHKHTPDNGAGGTGVGWQVVGAWCVLPSLRWW